jgi:serine protease Do
MLKPVMRKPLGVGVLALVCFAPAAAAQAPATSPRGLPALPTGNAASRPSPYEDPAEEGAAPGAAVDSPQATARQLYEHILRGVVALETNGVPVAIGTVLSGDGRVLTALSGLGGADGADVRYADGTVVHAKVGRSDRASDLALLIPQSLKRTEGLVASAVNPLGLDLRAVLPAHGVHLGPAMAAVKGQVDAHARDGAALSQMFDVDLKGPSIAGAPLLDSTGGVVAVLVRACKGPSAEAAPAPEDTSGVWSHAVASPQPARQACRPVILGAPVSTIRSFLSQAPSAPWLGIRGEPELSGGVHGVRVVAVAPASPAEKASLKPTSDLIVAVDGHPLDTPEKLAEIIAKHSPGDTVKLLVLSSDQFRDVSVALRSAP